MTKQALTVVFSHGQESGPWGTKITRMADAAKSWGAAVESVDYKGIADPVDRVEKLIKFCAAIEPPIVLVGSSMGGHVASTAALIIRPIGVFVLAPAFYMPGFEELTPIPPACPMAIVHGWRDDIVPVDNALKFARDAHCALHVLDGDHRLTSNIDEINVLFADFLSRVMPT